MKVGEIAAALKGYCEAPALEERLFLEAKSSISADEFIARRRAGEPASKIVGERGFWKDVFKTTVDVLDPRADSETLIETVLKYMLDKSAPYRILDIGTGSGCLLFSLLDEYQNATGVGVDKSEKALSVAAQNKKNRAAELRQVDFMQANWTSGLGHFDIIISNPPYIKSADIDTLDVGVKKYDPMLALDGGADGLDAYRSLAAGLSPLCRSGTKIFFEIGQGQETDVREIMTQNGFEFLSWHKDLGGTLRVIVFEQK